MSSNDSPGNHDTPRLVTDNEVAERRRLVYTVIVILLGFGILTSFNILYTNREIRKSDRVNCALFEAFDDRNNGIPATDAEGLKFIKIIRELRNNLPCDTDNHGPLPPLRSTQPTPTREGG